MSEWDEFAEDWDTPDTRRYADMAFSSWQRSVSPSVSNFAECTILDFGCGTGLLSEKFAPLCKRIVAIDTSEAMIAALKRKIETTELANVTPHVAAIDQSTVRSDPLLSGGFDIILASSVCAFLPDYPSTLRDLASLLKPGGLFTQWDWQGDMPADRISGAMEACGLERVAIDTAFEFGTGDQAMPVIMGTARRI